MSIVSDVGFMRLINTLEPRYNLPSQCYFTENVISLMKQRKDLQMPELIKNAHYFSFTMDIWSTSLHNQSLITLAIYYIDDCCARMSAVLYAQRIVGSHSGAASCQMIETMIDDWKTYLRKEYT